MEMYASLQRVYDLKEAHTSIFFNPCSVPFPVCVKDRIKGIIMGYESSTSACQSYKMFVIINSMDQQNKG